MTDKEKVKEEMRAISEDLIARSEELCRLDSYVGDGDHGISIRKGFSCVLDYLNRQADSVSGVFTNCSDAVLDSMGGAIGPIFASVFIGFAMASEGMEFITRDGWKKLFEKALEVVIKTGEARPGERTLVDTLDAAVRAFEEGQDKTEKDMWNLVLKRSEEGALNTKNMQARRGRARYLAEKSIGYVDAGAMTMYYFIRQIALAECRD